MFIVHWFIQWLNAIRTFSTTTISKQLIALYDAPFTTNSMLSHIYLINCSFSPPQCSIGLLLYRRFTSQRRQRILWDQLTKWWDFHKNCVRSRKARRICIRSWSTWRSTISTTEQQWTTKFRYVVWCYSTYPQTFASIFHFIGKK